MERMEFDLLFRWFVGLGVDEPAWDHSTFRRTGIGCWRARSQPSSWRRWWRGLK